jgi:hypothetical protein
MRQGEGISMISDEQGFAIASELFRNDVLCLPCPRCGWKFEKPVNWFEEHDHFTCSQQGCGEVQLSGVGEFRDGLKQAREGFIQMWNRIGYAADCKISEIVPSSTT